MLANFKKNIERAWYEKKTCLLLLRPLSLLYSAVHYVVSRVKKKYAWKAPVPVIVVGNITAGGSGKTPAVIAIVSYLQQQGYHPGVISRGYKSQAKQYPFFVDQHTKVKASGDEPLLIAKRTHAPVMIGANRKTAIKKLLQEHACDILVSDDGLQHYALQRDIEICVVDALRGFGNQRCLPEGPLRESVKRLAEVDFVISNAPLILDTIAADSHFRSGVELQAIRALNNDKHGTLLQKEVHAVAGIANPARFFNGLTHQGFIVTEHSFEDHHDFSASDFNFDQSRPIIMTEKDAVKCQSLKIKNAYYQPIAMTLDDGFYQALERRIQTVSLNLPSKNI